MQPNRTTDSADSHTTPQQNNCNTPPPTPRHKGARPRKPRRLGNLIEAESNPGDLSVLELAKRWKVSRRTVYDLIAKGALKAFRCHGHALVTGETIARCPKDCTHTLWVQSLDRPQPLA